MKKNFSDNRKAEYITSWGYHKTDVYKADLEVILLLLFIICDFVLDLFHTIGAIITIYKKSA